MQEIRPIESEPPRLDGFVELEEGRRVAYNIYGASLEASAEYGCTPVFLHHGMPGSRLGPIIKSSYLLGGSVTVIATDRPGYGESDPNPGRTVADVAYDIEAVADALKIDEFAVLGRSGGGPHALACAAKLQDRVIRAIALASSAPKMTMTPNAAPINQIVFGGDRSRAIAEIEVLAAAVQRDPASLLRHIGPSLSPSDYQVVKNSVISRQLRATYLEAVRKHGAAGWTADAIAIGGDWGFKLTDIPPTCTVDFWQPPDDDCVNSRASTNTLLEQIPHATMYSYPAGHFSSFEVTYAAFLSLAHGRPFDPFDSTPFDPHRQLMGALAGGRGDS